MCGERFDCSLRQHFEIRKLLPGRTAVARLESDARWLGVLAVVASSPPLVESSVLKGFPRLRVVRLSRAAASASECNRGCLQVIEKCRPHSTPLTARLQMGRGSDVCDGAFPLM